MLIASREHQTQSAYSKYEAVQMELAATRAVDPDLYEKTFELPDEHDLEILSNRYSNLHRKDQQQTFGLLIYDMAKTEGPLSDSYRASKRKLARHHDHYGV